MSVTITHSKVSGAGAPSDPSLVGGDDWDAAHVVVGVDSLVSVAGMKVATVALSSADLLDVHDAPVTLVAAPGAGKWINVHSYAATLTYGSSAYTISDGVAAFIGSVVAFDMSGILAETSDIIYTGTPADASFAPTDVDNQALVLTDQVADPTGGDGALTITVYYTVQSVTTGSVADIAEVPRTATVTLSSADILDLHNTPVTLVAAPGAGKFINLHRIVGYYSHGTTEYVFTSGLMLVTFGSTSLGEFDATANQDAITPLVSTVKVVASEQVNAALLLFVDAAITDGDGTLTITVHYTVEDVPA